MTDDNTPEENALLAKMRATATVKQLEELFAVEHPLLPPHPRKGRHVLTTICGCPVTAELYARRTALEHASVRTMSEHDLLHFALDNLASLGDPESLDEELLGLVRERADELQQMPPHTLVLQGDIITLSTTVRVDDAPIAVLAFTRALREIYAQARTSFKIETPLHIARQLHGKVKP